MKKSKQDKIWTTQEKEGWERPAVMVTILPGIQFLAYSWGTIDGHTFFDTVNDSRIELFNNPEFIIHSPSQGHTFDENFRYRELRQKESLIVQ